MASTINALDNDPTVEIIPLTGSLNQGALELFRQRADRALGLTDYISFLVMNDRRLTDALTSGSVPGGASFSRGLEEAGR